MHLIVLAPGFADDIPDCFTKDYHKMLKEYDLNLLEKATEGERDCDRPGVILLVEGNKLRGITPYVIKETEKLLYLEALALIIKK